MSMISSLIDELNKSADEWNSSNMFELARMCREAADTIWQLRDDLQRANTENVKLRDLCERCAVELYVNGNVTDAATKNLFDDMRELGMEVEESDVSTGLRVEDAERTQ